MHDPVGANVYVMFILEWDYAAAAAARNSVSYNVVFIYAIIIIMQ